MQTRELIEDLKHLLSEGQDGDKGRHMFILFGIKYAAEIEAEIEAVRGTTVAVLQPACKIGHQQALLWKGNRQGGQARPPCAPSIVRA